MRKVIVEEFISLDGVVQAPGGEEEDTSGGFEHGGWHMRYMDEPAQSRRDDGTMRPLRLVDSEVTPTGAIFATYSPV